MTAQRGIDRTLEMFLAEGPPMNADPVIEVALATVASTRQLRAGGLPLVKRAIRPRVLAWPAVVAVVLITAVLLLGPPGNIGGPSPSPTPTPVSSVVATPALYQTTTFGIPLSIRLPTGWSVAAEGAGIVDFDRAAILTIADTGIFDGQGLPQPWPTDIAAWLAAEPAFGPADQAAIVVGDRAGTAYTFDVDYAPPAAGERKPLIRAGSVRWNLVDAAERWRLVVVPTGPGEGLIGLLLASPSGFDSAAAAFESLLAGVQFR